MLEFIKISLNTQNAYNFFIKNIGVYLRTTFLCYIKISYGLHRVKENETNEKCKRIPTRIK